jgi:hypothetical protein
LAALSKDGTKLVWKKVGQWQIMRKKDPALTMESGVLHWEGGEGDKWRPHGGGTIGAAACLLPHRHARLVMRQPIINNTETYY